MRSGWFNLIHDSPMDYHSGKDALIVGDLDVGVVLLNGEEKYISELPCARMEAEMIGKLLELEPSRILRGDSTYPIAPIRYANKSPEKNDFILNMGEVSKVQLRAKLVVLSCCHNGRGKSKAERVFGITRAFSGSGARSVLASLWAVDAKATLQFMKQFYDHLVRGISASESPHETMKWITEKKY